MTASRRRTDGDETWIRLTTWIKGQKPAERLAAHILNSEGYELIDPSHPLGGRDGLKDLVCKKNDINWIVACYFPRSPKSFREIKSKFIDDFQGIEKNNAEGMIFVTNQELTLGQRKELKELSTDYEIEIYHLEKMAYLLNTPENYGVRLEFLDIEMNTEEQLSFFEIRDKKLNKLTNMLEQLMDDYSSFKKWSDNDDDARNESEVNVAIEELFDKIWYNRHQNLKYRILEEGEKIAPEIWKGALKAAKKVELKYGVENLGPWDDFEWGLLNGKLSALRWFFGDDWDMLDT